MDRDEIRQRQKDLRFDYALKILLIGNSGVGKSSIISRYIYNTFNYDIPSTLGLDFGFKIVEQQEKRIKLLIWDTAGQQRYTSVSSSVYKQSSGVIFVFDIGNQKSLQDIQRWMSQATQYLGQNYPRIIVANKTDMQWRIDSKDIRIFSQKHNIKCFFTSALNNTQIDQIFKIMVLLIHKPKQLQKSMKQPKLNNLKTSSLKIKQSSKLKSKQFCSIF